MSTGVGRMLAMVVVLSCAVSAWAAEAPAFVAGPTAAAEAGGVRIEFTVNAPTAVEVAVLDAKGQVVRHLMAGMLKADALKQSIVWDRKDDDGKAVAGDVSVRVGLGLAPKMEKVLGFDGNNLSNIVGLAVNAKGEVFVMTAESTYGRSMMRVLDKTGKYLRTVMPYSADVNAKRAAPMGQLTLDDKPIPIVFNAHGHNLLPMNSGMKYQNMVFLPNGNLVLASAVGTIVEHAPMRHLLAIAPDGGAPDGMPFIGPNIRKPIGMLGGVGEGSSTFFDHLACSPDGQTIYYATYANSYAAKPQHVVYRLKWTDAELGEPFLGQKGKSGTADDQFDTPQGLAVDAQGRLYVCDQGNDRVMVFTADGKLAGKFSVPTPEQVAVHPKTGTVFVVSRRVGRNVNAYTLRAFSPFTGATATELATLDGTASSAVMALDPSAEGQRLWIAHRSQLLPVVFDGAKFSAGANVLSAKGLNYPMFLAADAARNVVYVGEYKEHITRIDLTTGEATPFLKKGIEPVVDRDGNVTVLTGFALALERYTSKGDPAPFAAVGSNVIKVPAPSKGPSVGVRGMTIDRQNNIYLDEMAFYSVGNVFRYRPDGTKDSEPLIKRVMHGSSGLAIDPAGNFYLGSNLKPEGHPYSDSLASQLPKGGWVWWRGAKREGFWQWPYYNSYLYHWGSVLKFGPAGGEYWGGMAPHETKKGDPPPPVAPEGTPRYKSGYLNLDVWVKGAQWVHQGMGPIPASGLNWGDPSCTCWTSRLAVDEYGRVFVPNVFTFSVDVLDTNGSPIARIGRYGNPDDADGPAWAWPAFLSYSAGKVYVSDPLNCRVTVVSLGAQVEKTVGLK